MGIGSLPWQHIKCEDAKEKQKLVGQMKAKTTLTELCKNLPAEFLQFMEYVHSIKFKSTPDYKYLESLFRKVGYRHSFQLDGNFDWVEEVRHCLGLPSIDRRQRFLQAQSEIKAFQEGKQELNQQKTVPEQHFIRKSKEYDQQFTSTNLLVEPQLHDEQAETDKQLRKEILVSVSEIP